MPKRLVQLEGKPLFDLASYARPGSTRRDRLSPEVLRGNQGESALNKIDAQHLRRPNRSP